MSAIQSADSPGPEGVPTSAPAGDRSAADEASAARRERVDLVLHGRDGGREAARQRLAGALAAGDAADHRQRQQRARTDGAIAVEDPAVALRRIRRRVGATSCRPRSNSVYLGKRLVEGRAALAQESLAAGPHSACRMRRRCRGA